MPSQMRSLSDSEMSLLQFRGGPLYLYLLGPGELQFSFPLGSVCGTRPYLGMNCNLTPKGANCSHLRNLIGALVCFFHLISTIMSSGIRAEIAVANDERDSVLKAATVQFW